MIYKETSIIYNRPRELSSVEPHGHPTTGSGFWHWTVVNIPATARSIPAGAGSTAPAGDKPHRYVFTVWALEVDKLDLTAEASGAMVGFNLHANALGTAVMTAVFGR